MENNEVKPKKKSRAGLLILLIIIVFVFFGTGFFVIQPIGAIPNGITIWYLRVGLNLPFVTSPDGFSIKKTGELSLMSRMMAMSAITDSIKDRIIIRLPYSRIMYLISTGGKEYGK